MPIQKFITVSKHPITGKINRYYVPVNVTLKESGSIELDFPYDDWLKDEVKSMEGARWNPDKRCWTVKNCPRNHFQLAFLRGENPYSWYDQTLIEFEPRIKKIYPQQVQMAREALTYKQVIWAAEMGLGKTLAAIEVIEHAAEMFNVKNWWWIGPRSALASFDVEVGTWGMKCYPEQVMTYDALVKTMAKWPAGVKGPQGVIFDESSRLKTPTAKRTQAAQALADSIRADHGENEAFVILMTGTPAPKTPLDWYSQAEIAKPGFIREGNIHKFRDRLGVVVKKENTTTGGVYPQVNAWRDSEDKCAICGYHSATHDLDVMGQQMEPHNWVRGTNEVAKLYKRTKGLVFVYFKKDWLSHLPDKTYRILRCKVSRSTENAARAVKASATSAIQALTMLRELSDGFLYQEEVSGTTTCPLCKGSCKVEIPVLDANEQMHLEIVPCTTCGGSGEVPRSIRVVDSVACPKDDLLEEILDDHSEDGRLVVYAGFTGSVDRVVATCKRKGWETIRVDGRGWSSDLGATPKELLDAFQKKGKAPEKLAFVGHPGAAGMGITLTASSEIVYYSNDFNAESRLQSEDRIHRPGMDVNKGAMITDLVHLPSDILVLENLKNKRRLQDMSLGQFQESLKMAEEGRL